MQLCSLLLLIFDFFKQYHNLNLYSCGLRDSFNVVKKIFYITSPTGFVSFISHLLGRIMCSRVPILHRVSLFSMYIFKLSVLAGAISLSSCVTRALSWLWSRIEQDFYFRSRISLNCILLCLYIIDYWSVAYSNIGDGYTLCWHLNIHIILRSTYIQLLE